jgi:hypothetical protein
MSLSKPLSHPSSNNSFLIAAKKFHVTNRDRRGYNSIYEFKRSKSYFFELVDPYSITNETTLLLHTNDYLVSTTPIRYRSTSKNVNQKYQISKMLTHFFSIQRVLPRRIQTKYFNLIRDNLLKRITIISQRITSPNDHHKYKITRTFFKFTYKKYRFYFSIHTPCNRPENPQNSNYNPCHIQSPFVMKNNLRACCLHQRQLFLVTNGINTDSFNTVGFNDHHKSKNQTSRFKIDHSNRIYDKWCTKSTKEVHSRHLGILYRMYYRANTNAQLLRQDKRHMYLKYYNNFGISQNYSGKTLIKQKKHRERLKNRILKSHNAEAIKDENYQKFAFRRKGYIFDENSYFHKRISHLQYHVNEIPPSVRSYAYHIPYFLFPIRLRQ